MGLNLKTMYIKDAQNKEIGKILENVCMLADLDIPKYPAEIVEFIKQNYGKYNINVIKDSMYKWIMGIIDVKKPERLNAQFVATVIYKAINSGLLGEIDIQKPQVKKTENFVKLTPEEERQGYEDMRKIWYEYEESKKFDSFPMFFSSKYEFIRTFDDMQYPDFVLEIMISELKLALEDKYKRDQTKNNPFMTFINNFSLPNINWRMFACVCLHYRTCYANRNIQS